MTTQNQTSHFAWRKVLLVATREYVATVRTKAFLIALIMMPVLTLGALVVPLFATQLNAGQPKPCAIVDETGLLLEALRARLAEARTEGPSADPLVDAQSAWMTGFSLVDGGHTIDSSTRATLSEQVRQGQLFAFVTIPKDVLLTDGEAPVTYTTNTPTSRGPRQWLQRRIEAEVHRIRLERLGFDTRAIARAEQPILLQEGSLMVERGGQIAEGPAPSEIRDVVLPIGAAFLMFMALMLGASPMMQSTLEEKMYRIAEVIVSSVPPLSLMLGKLLGAALVSYTIVSLYIGGGLFVAAQAGFFELLGVGDLLVIAFFFATAFVMYGSVFLAVGAACNDLKETQSLMMPAIMLITTPLLLMQVVMDEPNGPAATWLSFFPFFTPPLMLLRWLVSPGAPVWQVVLGAASSLLMAAACLYTSSRVFRVGLLVQGAAPSYRTLWRWIQQS